MDDGTDQPPEAQGDGPNRLWLYRTCWSKFDTEDSDYILRRSVRLQTDYKNPDPWYFGLKFPRSRNSHEGADLDSLNRIGTTLQDQLGLGEPGSDVWPWYKYADQQKRDWNTLLPDLHRECEGNGGEISNYFVNTFVEIAVEAIQIINEIEGTQK